MKKLMTLMLGLSLLGGTFAMFAQDAPKKEDTTMKKSGKKGGKKKTEDTTKKGGSR